MGRIFKFLAGLAVLTVIGLLGYSYSGLMEPATGQVTQSVTLDAD